MFAKFRLPNAPPDQVPTLGGGTTALTHAQLCSAILAFCNGAGVELKASFSREQLEVVLGMLRASHGGIVTLRLAPPPLKGAMLVSLPPRRLHTRTRTPVSGSSSASRRSR